MNQTVITNTSMSVPNVNCHLATVFTAVHLENSALCYFPVPVSFNFFSFQPTKQLLKPTTLLLV